MKYCATTVAFPQFDMRETAELLSRLGFDGAEWRVRRIPEAEKGKPYSPWGNHKNDLSPDNLKARADELKAIGKEYGLAIAGLAPNIQADQLDDIRLLAEGAVACGAPFFRVGAPRGYDRTANYNDLYDEAVRAYEKALEISRSYGVRILLEIHGGTIMVSASLAHRIVSKFDPKDIGVIYDTNNMTKEGFETYRIGLELLGPYLAHSHVGNHTPHPEKTLADGTLEWAWEGAGLAAGLTNYPQVMADLKAVGFDGFISIEDFREMDAEKKLREGIGYLKGLGNA
ncbi:MAG: sugar phosphate isomerase/epimerase [Candidatus Latescibacteria bacterium]|nr:sugar phosphate isomerase/epimerase [Candidatus Latescibacterota bacterium]